MTIDELQDNWFYFNGKFYTLEDIKEALKQYEKYQKEKSFWMKVAEKRMQDEIQGEYEQENLSESTIPKKSIWDMNQGELQALGKEIGFISYPVNNGDIILRFMGYKETIYVEKKATFRSLEREEKLLQLKRKFMEYEQTRLKDD